MKVTLLDFPEHVACTVFTGGCNFRCPFCHNSELLGPKPQAVMTTEELFVFLDKRRGRLEGVAITGGEPTLHQELPGMMRAIKRNFGMAVKLDTNGSNPDMLSEVIQDGTADYVAMDIKSGPSGYSEAAGIIISRELMHRITMSKDMLIGQCTADYEFRTTVVGGIHKDRDFEEIGEYISGAERYFLQCYTESERVLCLDRGFYSPDRKDLDRYLRIVKPFVKFAALRGVD